MKDTNDDRMLPRIYKEVENPVILGRTWTGFWRLEGILNELHIKLINKDHKNSKTYQNVKPREDEGEFG